MTQYGQHSIDRSSVPARGGSASSGHHRRKHSNASKVLLIIGFTLLAVAVIGFGFLAFRYLSASKHFERIATEYATTEGTGVEDYRLDVDWNGLKAENSDIVAWICVPDTVVNYPVVRASDNDYYLSHDFNGNSSVSGCIFLDCDSASDFTDRNSIIYGHNMLDGSMFASFAKYTDETYLSEHPYILLATPNGTTHRLKIFGVVVASGSEELRQTHFSDDAEYQAYVQTVLDRNEISTTVTADEVSHLYTFATCSYQFNDARTIVYAVEVDKYGNILTSTSTDLVETSAG